MSTAADQFTTTELGPLVPMTFVGGAGTAAGDVGAVGAVGADVPTSLRAVTTNVYDTPFDRLLNVHDVVTVGQTKPPGFDVTE